VAAGADAGGAVPAASTAGLPGRIIASPPFSDPTADLQIRGLGLNQSVQDKTTFVLLGELGPVSWIFAGAHGGVASKPARYTRHAGRH